MDDNYLDKKLKGILETPREFDPDPAAMLDMKQRLRNAKEPDRRQHGNFWWLLVGLLLLLSGGYLFYQLQQLNRQVEDLSEQLFQLNREDTIVEHHTIYRIDTIYQTIYRERYVEQAISNRPIPYFRTPSSYYLTNGQSTLSSNLPKQLNLGWSFRDYQHSLLTMGPLGSSFLTSGIKPDTNAAILAMRKPEEDQETTVVPPLSKYQLKELISLDGGAGMSLDPDYQFLRVRKNAVHPMYYFTPIGFNIGLHASPVIQFTYPFEGNGYSLGINGAIEFPQHRSLNFSGELLGVNFEVKDPALFEDFPALNPDDPTDQLHELKGNFQYVQIYTGFRQRFLAGSKLQPALSIGVVAHRPLQKQLTYEFLGNGTEYGISNDQQVGSNFSLSSARFGLGLDYKLGKRIDLETAGVYQQAFSLPTDEYFQLQYWALHLGLKYKLSKK